jgi:hypothetical protein
MESQLCSVSAVGRIIDDVDILSLQSGFSFFEDEEVVINEDNVPDSVNQTIKMQYILERRQLIKRLFYQLPRFDEIVKMNDSSARLDSVLSGFGFFPLYLSELSTTSSFALNIHSKAY